MEASCEGKADLLPPHVFELPARALGSDMKDSAIVIVGDSMSGNIVILIVMEWSM